MLRTASLVGGSLPYHARYLDNFLTCVCGSVLGITRNYVELPTAVKQGALRIKISGKVELNLSLHTSKLYTCVPGRCKTSFLTNNSVPAP